MTIAETINTEIKEAMKSRNQVRLDTLRMLKSKILTADARGNLSDQDVLKLFKTYYGNLQEALEQGKASNRQDIVEKLKAEMAIVEEFLPKTLSKEETHKIVVQAIQATNAKTKKETGLVMKEAMKLSSNLDGKVVKEIVDGLLI